MFPSNLMFRLTHNSLATIIAWLSTCLLAGGVSTLFNDNSRVLWLFSGCFGLAAAVGLDIAARSRERKRSDDLRLIAASRIERDIGYENEEYAANSAIRRAVALLLGQISTGFQGDLPHRNRARVSCDLGVELLVHQCFAGTERRPGFFRTTARITNLSELGFEMKHSDSLPRQRMEMSISSARGTSQILLGELLWCTQRPNGTFVSGGRFLDVSSRRSTNLLR